MERDVTDAAKATDPDPALASKILLFAQPPAFAPCNFAKPGTSIGG
jgi:hypothetical protein